MFAFLFWTYFWSYNPITGCWWHVYRICYFSWPKHFQEISLSFVIFKFSLVETKCLPLKFIIFPEVKVISGASATTLRLCDYTSSGYGQRRDDKIKYVWLTLSIKVFGPWTRYTSHKKYHFTISWVLLVWSIAVQSQGDPLILLSQLKNGRWEFRFSSHHDQLLKFTDDHRCQQLFLRKFIAHTPVVNYLFAFLWLLSVNLISNYPIDNNFH